MSIEQRINLKFLVGLGKTPTETFNLLQEVYGDATMSRTRIFEWHKRFREGREDVEDDPKSGKPTTSRTNENVQCVREKVRSDRRLTVRMIADELSMNSERVWRIITEDLGMRKVCAKMVPRLLNDGQKENRVQVCQYGYLTKVDRKHIIFKLGLMKQFVKALGRSGDCFGYIC